MNLFKKMSQEIIEGYRLSPQQKRLWLLGQSDRRAQCVVRIDGALKSEGLDAAVRQVVSQHESLRTTFKLLPGMTIPVQVISDDSDVAFSKHDLTPLGVDEQDARIRELVGETLERRVDFDRSPLFESHLITQSANKHVLIISLPVACADAPSLDCLVRQIAAAYKTSSQAEDQWTIDAMQYADFAEWQNELLEAEGRVAAQFWQQQYLLETDVQKLSFEQQAVSADAPQLATMPLEISAGVSARIKALADRSGVAVSSFALACWQILLSRLTEHANIVVGVAFDGRKFAELADAIGLFSTFVPLRGEVTADLRFEKFLQQTSAQQREAQRWQEYFAWQTSTDSDNASARFLPFCFESRKHTSTYLANDVQFSVYENEAPIDRCKINFRFDECDDRLSASLQFDPRLFLVDDVRRLADQLKTLLADASRRPGAALGDLELSSDAERELVVVGFNDTKRSYATARSVCELFEEQVARDAENVALVFEDNRLTYGELNARANQLAHHLARLGVGPDVPVGLCLDRSVELIVGVLGILKAGGAYVPLDAAVPSSRQRDILTDSGVRVLVSTNALAAPLQTAVDHVVCLDAQLLANESIDNSNVAVAPENLVYVIFTSGSTGRPKGVAVEHRQLLNYINAVSDVLALPLGSSFASISTIAADLGNTAVFPALCKGGTLHLIAEQRSTDPVALADYFKRHRIDCLKIVPTHLAALLTALPVADLLPRKRLVLGGEACPWSLVEKVSSLAPDCVIVNHYGPTEATVGAVTNVLNHENSERLTATVPLGRPLANVQAYILDQQLRPAPIGVPGELHLGGAGLARAYINRPDATAEKFIPNPFSKAGARLYKTGDQARYLSDGRIEFLGRIDQQVKIRGHRIEPREIELALLDREEVSECVVIAREDQPGDKRLVAYVVTRMRTTNPSDLRAFLSGRLPEYMSPSAFVFLDRLPLTANGKLDRRALPPPDHSRPDGDSVFVAPRNPVEETLAKIWSTVLGVERVGVHDNFFDLGGDSILSIQIIARANQAGLGLSPRQLFQHQTVSELASVTESATVVAEQGAITGDVPLIPVQARFFELNQPNLHHYNQAMLLEVRGETDTSWFAAAIKGLLRQHDALRMRFKLHAGAWQAAIVLPDDFVPFETVDLSRLDDAEQSHALAIHAAHLHTTLNITDGPLMCVALFDRGAQRNSYLLIVIHHLVVDTVSWRILLEDLQTLYQQAAGDRDSTLPAKTTSFKSWAERLTEYARSAAVLDELPYWVAVAQDSASRLPVDKPGGANTVAEGRTISVSLSEDETRALLQDVPVAYRTQVNEVFLTALVRAFARWTGSPSLLVDLEGHGREEIVDGVNVSRTVGWFTTIFPVMLDGNAPSAVAVLQSVKEQLRAIPNRGIGYGLLRYSSGDATVAEKLRAAPQAEVRFNYLGQVDRALVDSSMFSTAPESRGPAQSSSTDRVYLLNIIGVVSGGKLQLDWTFSESIHHKETITRVAQSFVEELRTLITQSRTNERINYSPSDFPSAQLSQDELNKVLAKLRR